MSNKKSIDDKQLIRSIADVVLYNPSFARDIFSTASEIVDIFPELNELADFVLFFYKDEQYYEQLTEVIKNIKDPDTKAIFISSLLSFNSSRNEQNG